MGTGRDPASKIALPLWTQPEPGLGALLTHEGWGTHCGSRHWGGGPVWIEPQPSCEGDVVVAVSWVSECPQSQLYGWFRCCRRHSFTTRYVLMVQASFCKGSHLKKSAVQKTYISLMPLLSKVLKNVHCHCFNSFAVLLHLYKLSKQQTKPPSDAVYKPLNTIFHVGVTVFWFC